MKCGPGSAVTGSCHLIVIDGDYVCNDYNLISGFLFKGNFFLEPEAEIYSTRMQKHPNTVDFLSSSRDIMGGSCELRAMTKSKLEQE